jgi:hypothetical protein
MTIKQSAHLVEYEENNNPLDESFMKGCFWVIAWIIAKAIWKAFWIFIILAVIFGIPLIFFFLTHKP